MRKFFPYYPGLVAFLVIAIAAIAQPKAVLIRRPVRPATPISNPVQPGIVLTWSPPSNSCYVIQATTNFVTWYFKTNQPLSSTSVFIPKGPNAEYYRAYTALQQTAGGFYVQSLDVLTNTP